jgi:hypothetical protein
MTSSSQQKQQLQPSPTTTIYNPTITFAETLGNSSWVLTSCPQRLLLGFLKYTSCPRPNVPVALNQMYQLPSTECTSCPHMLIYTRLQYIACKIGEVNIQIINKIIYKNNVK